MEVITTYHPKLKRLFKALDRISEYFQNYSTQKCLPLDGEYLLMDKEVSEKLKISRRTLQDYRDQGIVSYIHLVEKILYKESDLQKMLEAHYYQARKE